METAPSVASFRVQMSWPFSQALRSSDPRKSSRASARVSRALRGRDWMRVLGRAEGAAAELELAEGESVGFGLAAFLPSLLPPEPEDLAVGHVAGEVVDGDPTHGAGAALRRRSGSARQ
jgi:hypothetical protein